MDELVTERVEDDAEVAARAHFQQLVPSLLTEWEEVDKDLKAIKLKYGLQPQSGQSQVMVKVE